MRNRTPRDGLSGQILPPAHRASGRDVDPYRTPQLPALEDFDGVFNVVARLRAWGQQKGYEALTETLVRYEVALRAQEGVARAIESLELQEERLRPQNLNLLKEAGRRDIDRTLEEATGRYHDAARRTQHSELRAEITDEELRRQLAMARRLRLEEEAKAFEKPGAAPVEPEPPSVEEQLTALAEKLIEAQEKLNRGIEDGTWNEAAIHAQEQQISYLLGQMEKLRANAG